MIFGWIFRRQPPQRDEAREILEAWTNRVEPLGYRRRCVLACLSAQNPKKPCYFNPPPDAPLHDALRDHLERLFVRFSSEEVARPYDVLIFAAGLMTYGRLDMAEFIISNLLSKPFFTDHGAGRCVTLPYAFASALLPLPADLRNLASIHAVEWVAGTPAGNAVQDWFAANKHRLVWDAASERFVL
jgi:hypothetical protein